MSSRRWLILILVFYAVLASLYNLTTLPFEAPDEYWHYFFVREVGVSHALPVVDVNGTQPFRHEGLQAPLYYVLASPIIAWMDPQATLQIVPRNPFVRIGEPEIANHDNRNYFIHSAAEDFPYQGSTLALHLVRLISTLFGAGTIILTYLLAQELFPRTREGAYAILPLLAAASVAFLPQFLYVNSTVSNDSATIFTSNLLLWQIVRLDRRGLNVWRAIALGVTLGLALLAKLSSLVWVPFTVLALAFLMWRHHWYKQGLMYGTLILVIAALLGGWWYLRNLQLYGALLTSDMIAQMVGTRPTFLSLDRWIRSEAEGVWLSTWGVFGWFNILAPAYYYWFYNITALVGAIGVVYGLTQKRLRENLSPMLLLLPVWMGLVIFALWYFSASVISNQGRLLFPALPAYAVLWAWGVLTLVPFRWQVAVVTAIATAFALIAAVVPSALIAPAYQPEIVADGQSTTTAAKGVWHFQNGMQWVDAQLDKRSVKPGDVLTVTLYEHPTSPPRTDQALFIHVVDSAGAIVAQRDSLPGQGNPSALAPGGVSVESYPIEIPLTAAVSPEWRVLAGMYDVKGGTRVPIASGTRTEDDSVQLGTVQVAPASAWNYDFGGIVKLDGAELNPLAVVPGKKLKLTLHWGGMASGHYRVFVHVLGEADHLWGAADADIHSDATTQIELPIDRSTPPGMYPLEVGVYPAPDGDRVEVFDAQGLDLGDRLFLGPIRVGTKE